MSSIINHYYLAGIIIDVTTQQQRSNKKTTEQTERKHRGSQRKRINPLENSTSGFLFKTKNSLCASVQTSAFFVVSSYLLIRNY